MAAPGEMGIDILTMIKSRPEMRNDFESVQKVSEIVHFDNFGRYTQN